MIPISSLVGIQYCYTYLLNQISVDLLVYSHIPAAIVALLFGGYLLYKKRGTPTSALFIVCVTFAIWCFLDLCTWFAFFGSSTTMFTWSLVDAFSLVFFFFSYYFLYSFTTEKDLPLWQKITGVCLLLPTFFWTFFGSNLQYFDLNSCQAVENTSVTNYLFAAEIVFIVAVIAFAITQYIRNKDRVARQKLILASGGVLIFLSFFFFGTFIASYLADNNIWVNAYNIEIYGLFGMPFLLVFLGDLIVKHKAFNLKIITSQALVVALIVLAASQFAFLTDFSAIALNCVSLILLAWIGLRLIRNVKAEIEAREKIQTLATSLKSSNEELASANARLHELDQQKSEFVSLASHQLRSPLAAIRGYVSLITEGEYGEVPEAIKDPLVKISESIHSLVIMVEDFLNVSRIEQGRLKFEFADFDVAKLAEQVLAEMKPSIEKAGLSLSYDAEPGKSYIMNGDANKIKQVFNNFVDNSVKYTPQGSISMHVGKNDAGVIKVVISDTGVGIAPEVIPKLFSKFTRAPDANKTNVQGTGLGLYVARQMVEAHKGGKVWAESDGPGKGSRFCVELQGN